MSKNTKVFAEIIIVVLFAVAIIDLSGETYQNIRSKHNSISGFVVGATPPAQGRPKVNPDIPITVSFNPPTGTKTVDTSKSDICDMGALAHPCGSSGDSIWLEQNTICAQRKANREGMKSQKDLYRSDLDRIAKARQRTIDGLNAVLESLNSAINTFKVRQAEIESQIGPLPYPIIRSSYTDAERSLMSENENLQVEIQRLEDQKITEQELALGQLTALDQQRLAREQSYVTTLTTLLAQYDSIETSYDEILGRCTTSRSVGSPPSGNLIEGGPASSPEPSPTPQEPIAPTPTPVPDVYKNLTLFNFNQTADEWVLLPTSITTDSNGTVDVFTETIPISRFFALADKTAETPDILYLQPIKYFELETLPQTANETLTFEYLIEQNSTIDATPTPTPSCSSSSPGFCYTQSDCTSANSNWCPDTTGAVFACQSAAC